MIQRIASLDVFMANPEDYERAVQDSQYPHAVARITGVTERGALDRIESMRHAWRGSVLIYKGRQCWSLQIKSAIEQRSLIAN